MKAKFEKVLEILELISFIINEMKQDYFLEIFTSLNIDIQKYISTWEQVLSKLFNKYVGLQGGGTFQDLEQGGFANFVVYDDKKYDNLLKYLYENRKTRNFDYVYTLLDFIYNPATSELRVVQAQNLK